MRGAHVVARDADGHVAGAILTGSDGSFVLQGLDAGQYTVYVDPLDRPVSSANLGGGQTIETNFETRILGTVTVATGEGRRSRHDERRTRRRDPTRAA